MKQPLVHKAHTIDEVILLLLDYIDTCYQQKNRMGYFASLYARVTIAVKIAITEEYFNDNARMERLDVNFANYLLQNLQDPNAIWKSVFDLAQKRGYVMFQHLLAGMNSHINFDLAFATFDTQNASGEPLAELFDDFMKINAILTREIDSIQALMGRSWFFFDWIDALFLRFDERYVSFRLIKARDSAWVHALKLSQGSDKQSVQNQLELLTLQYLHNITNPPWYYKIVVWLNRLFENFSIQKNIALLRPDIK